MVRIGGLDLDVPLLAPELVEQVEALANAQTGRRHEQGRGGLGLTASGAGGERRAQIGQEFAAKLRRQHGDRQQELRVGGRPFAVRRESAGGDDEVQVQMLPELVAPALEDRHDARQRPQPTGVGQQFAQRVPRRQKVQIRE